MCLQLQPSTKFLKVQLDGCKSYISSSQMVDLVFFYFTSHFYFYSILFFYFLFLEQLGLGLIGHTVTSVTKQIMRLGRIQQKIREQMMSYNINTICWPYGLHMVVQGRVHSSLHGPSVGLYKVDQFVEEFSIEFSCVSLIQELFLFPTLRSKFTTQMSLWLFWYFTQF